MSKILIVDDEKSIRLTLGKFLADAGHEILTAEDADTGLALLKQHECDLVISDIVLPRITGVEMLKAIHAQSPELPVVMMTGEPALETAVEAVRAGAFDYLSKPINKPAIMRVVEQALRMRALQLEKARLEEANRQYRQNLERMVAERTSALRESEARLRTLFNEAPIGIWELDFSAVQARFEELRASGVQDFQAYFDAHPEPTASFAALVKIVEVNQSSVRLFGAASKQDLPQQLSAFFTADSPAVFARGLAALAQGLPRFETEFPARTIANAEIALYLIMVVVPGHAAKLDRVLVSFVNITERKQAELDLRASEERFHTLVDHAPNGIFIQTNLRFVYVNLAALELFGARTPDELVGCSMMDRVHPEWHDAVIARVCQPDQPLLVVLVSE